MSAPRHGEERKRLMASEKRVYPVSCTSAYCGRIECPPDCPFLPKLKEFRAWKERTGAKPADPIWSPNVYVVPSC